MEYMPIMTGVSCYFDFANGISQNEWKNLIGDDNISLFGANITSDYLELVGSENSYGVLNHNGDSGGGNTVPCTKYFVLKNLSNVFTDWRTIIGNEFQSYYCSTLAMNSSGYLQFTRKEVYSSTMSNKWNVIALRCDFKSHSTGIYINGIKIGTASNTYGCANDTFLARGSTWSYQDNNTAFKSIVIADTLHTEEDIITNSVWLKLYYINSGITSSQFLNYEGLSRFKELIYDDLSEIKSRLSALENE